MGENLPARRAFGHLLRVDGDDNALVAEFFRGIRHEAPVRHGGRVDRNLVGARPQQRADILKRAHPASHRQRHEAALGGAAHHIEDDAPLLMARGDIEEAEFVRACRVIGCGGLDRVARIAQIDEVHALDDAPILDIETRYDADFEHERGRVRRAAGDLPQICITRQNLHNAACLTIAFPTPSTI